MPKLFRMLKVEFNISWKTIIVSSLTITLLSLIPIMVRNDINVHQGSALVSTISMISPTITQVYLYAVALRLISVIKDKSTLDKNRAAFLTHNKGTVVFAKVFMDMISFILPIILTVGIGIPMVYGKNGFLDTEYVGKLIALLFAITFAYAGTSIGMRYIDTLPLDRIKKYVIMGTWVLLTIGVTVIGAMVVGILGHVKRDGLTNSTDIKTWFASNGITGIETYSQTPITISDDIMADHHILSYSTNYITIPPIDAPIAPLPGEGDSLSPKIDLEAFLPGYHLTSITLNQSSLYTDSSVNIQNFFNNNQIVVSIIPGLNFITPFLPFYKLMDAWTVAPLIAEVIIFIGVIWKPLTRRLKTHLTT